MSSEICKRLTEIDRPRRMDVRLRSVAACLALAVAALCAQEPKSFEVASIKPNRSGGTESNLDSRPNGKTFATNILVGELIQLAFTMKDRQILGAPQWIDSERYDIAAETAPVKSTSLDQEKALIRQLLADRFAMKSHMETREMPAYLLVIGKGGSKLTEHNDGTGSSARPRCGHLSAKRLTADTIATVLSRQLESEVLNRTSLNGKYDFELDWTPDAGPCADAGDAAARPSIFTAVQEQLGLKLEKSKAPVQVLIVDHIERPSVD